MLHYIYILIFKPANHIVWNLTLCLELTTFVKRKRHAFINMFLLFKLVRKINIWISAQFQINSANFLSVSWTQSQSNLFPSFITVGRFGCELPLLQDMFARWYRMLTKRNTPGYKQKVLYDVVIIIYHSFDFKNA